MRRAMAIALAGLIAAFVGGSLAAAAGTQPGVASLDVPRAPSVRANVNISFRSTASLAVGGYYYAVIVLEPYRHYTREHPPSCAISSDMQRTDYGYPQASGIVALALTPTSSRTHALHWCPGGRYAGAIYAVPHPPPCESKYPCHSETDERPPLKPCWSVEGRVVCGVVAYRTFPEQYPEPLPEPVAKGARIIARFGVSFPSDPRAAERRP